MGIARAQRLSSPKVGDARSVLLEQHIDAFGHQRGDQEVVAVQRIGEHHFARIEAVEQAAHQAEFSAAFALMRPDRGIQRGTGGQTHHHDQARQWKTKIGRAHV